jgi:hypothetical protein
MPIKINGQTSGSVTLSAPDTGSDVTLSLPGSNLDLAAIPQANISNLTTDLAAKLPIAGGKILQIVRATDTTNRSTTSTNFVDVTGMSVTITPQENTSAILLIASGFSRTDSTSSTNSFNEFRLTTSGGSTISGAQSIEPGASVVGTTIAQLTLIGYATPGVTTAVSYKLQFRVNSVNRTAQLVNANQTGQMYAIEVSA